jgi:hypothetical protein
VPDAKSGSGAGHFGHELRKRSANTSAAHSQLRSQIASCSNCCELPARGANTPTRNEHFFAATIAAFSAFTEGEKRLALQHEMQNLLHGQPYSLRCCCCHTRTSS